MKASPRQQQLLLDLQELDNTIARLRRKRKTLPQRATLAGMADETDAVKQGFMAAQRELDMHAAEFDRIESDVVVVAQRVARDEQLLAGDVSAKEAQALTAELEQLKGRAGVLEEKQLEIMELQETAKAAFDAAAAALAAVDSRRDALQAEIDAADADLVRELKVNINERAGLAAEVQRDVLGVYEDLRSRLGMGAARLRGNVSEASNIALAPAELTDILAAPADELVYCPGTGVILVRGAAE